MLITNIEIPVGGRVGTEIARSIEVAVIPTSLTCKLSAAG